MLCVKTESQGAEYEESIAPFQGWNKYMILIPCLTRKRRLRIQVGPLSSDALRQNCEPERQGRGI